MNYNKQAVAEDYRQRTFPKVLFICSAGILRSATAAHIFASEPYNWNTRSAGSVLEYALNPVTEANLRWADEIFLMDREHMTFLASIFPDSLLSDYRDKMHVLNIQDDYEYREPALVKALYEQVLKVSRFGQIS